jgi:chromosome segregation ATPase
MLEYSYYAAAFTGIATIAAAWLSFRGSWHSARLTSTAASLDAQLRGWKNYCDVLNASILELHRELGELRIRFAEQERLTRECKDAMWAAERKIRELESRLDND